jgi:hypothetical protein
MFEQMWIRPGKMEAANILWIYEYIFGKCVREDDPSVYGFEEGQTINEHCNKTFTLLAWVLLNKYYKTASQLQGCKVYFRCACIWSNV